MFYHRFVFNPVTEEQEKHFVKKFNNGDFVFFAEHKGPLFDQLQEWIANGNETTEWVG